MNARNDAGELEPTLRVGQDRSRVTGHGDDGAGEWRTADAVVSDTADHDGRSLAGERRGERNQAGKPCEEI